MSNTDQTSLTERLAALEPPNRKPPRTITIAFRGYDPEDDAADNGTWMVSEGTRVRDALDPHEALGLAAAMLLDAPHPPLASPFQHHRAYMTASREKSERIAAAERHAKAAAEQHDALHRLWYGLPFDLAQRVARALGAPAGADVFAYVTRWAADQVLFKTAPEASAAIPTEPISGHPPAEEDVGDEAVITAIEPAGRSYDETMSMISELDGTAPEIAAPEILGSGDTDIEAVRSFVLAAAGMGSEAPDEVRLGARIYGEWKATAGFVDRFHGVGQGMLDEYIERLTALDELQAIADGLEAAGFARSTSEISEWRAEWRIEAQNYVNAREAWAAGQGRDDGTDIAEWEEREPKAPWFLTGAADPNPDLPF